MHGNTASSWLRWASIGLVACAARSERQQHVVIPPVTTEVSEGFGGIAPPIDPELACPMTVEGANVLLLPIKGGSALVFTTALASPVEIRRKVWYFAALYDADGSPLPGLQPREVSPAGFPTSAQYSEVAAGARVELRALSDHQAAALKAHLRGRFEHMRSTQSC